MKDKVVLVTGGTSGIGKTAAIAFAEKGAKVVFSGRREAEGQAVADQIEASGGNALFVKSDITVESEVKALVQTVVDTHGRLDIAFNNAGVEHIAPLVDSNLEAFRKVMDTNVWGVLLSLKYEIQAMLETSGGSIVNTSSIAGQIAFPGGSIYVASKHAVEGLTKTAALEYAQQGIRVNSVSPAAIETDMFERFSKTLGEENTAGFVATHPIGRAGKPREVADAVLFLASDEASFITGHNLPVDGGWLAQ